LDLVFDRFVIKLDLVFFDFLFFKTAGFNFGLVNTLFVLRLVFKGFVFFVESLLDFLAVLTLAFAIDVVFNV